MLNILKNNLKGFKKEIKKTEQEMINDLDDLQKLMLEKFNMECNKRTALCK